MTDFCPGSGCLVGGGQFFGRPGGDGLEGADGGGDVLGVELGQEPGRRGGHICAQVVEEGLALGGEVDLVLAADQPFGVEPVQQVADRVGVQRARAFELAAQLVTGALGPCRSTDCRANQVSGAV
jgi:hypothetical protein